MRYEYKGGNALLSYFAPPLVVPGVVTGFALLGVLFSIGFFRSFYNLLIAQIIITIPYTVRAVTATLAGFERTLAVMNLCK